MSVRPALPHELESVGALTAAAYVTPGGMAADDPYVAVLRDAADRAAHAEVWVAADPDATLLGTVTWCPAGSSYRELAGPGEGEFRMLAVSPSARGRGVGEALVRRCLARSVEAGHTRVVISTSPWMASAHRLYARLGFTEAPELSWSPRPDLTLLAYVRPLP
ncbi:MAG: GNAT family N-acetyltransferase [Propionicimonas sp.]|uniref:GNAT family N-acetyltransferase n=1 Tax=Propionicimonas sp. TaxID=1955623 RepID=UPI003D0E578F